MLCLCGGPAPAESMPLRGGRKSCDIGREFGDEAASAGDKAVGSTLDKANTLLVKATQLLRTLALSPGAERDLPRGANPLPPSEVIQAAGLAFIFTHKCGLGLSFQHGHGLLISKLPREASPSCRRHRTWSAPLFFGLRAGGFGATLGYSELQSVVILDTQDAVDDFLKTQFSLEAEMAAAAGKRMGRSFDATAASLRAGRSTAHSFSYTLVRGALVDISWKGVALSAHDEWNAQLYGRCTSWSAILSGDVRPHSGTVSALRPLHEVLGRLLWEPASQHRRARAALGLPEQRRAAPRRSAERTGEDWAARGHHAAPYAAQLDDLTAHSPFAALAHVPIHTSNDAGSDDCGWLGDRDDERTVKHRGSTLCAAAAIVA